VQHASDVCVAGSALVPSSRHHAVGARYVGIRADTEMAAETFSKITH
jgi:hypothetical protein